MCLLPQVARLLAALARLHCQLAPKRRQGLNCLCLPGRQRCRGAAVSRQGLGDESHCGHQGCAQLGRGRQTAGLRN